VSVVSHGQNRLVNLLLRDLAAFESSRPRILVTQNIPEAEPLEAPAGAEVIVNTQPKGFGANHNAAFRRCTSELFCVVNPDIRLHLDPFPALASALHALRAGVAGPLVRDPEGRVEDSARRFPTLRSLFDKARAGASGPEYAADRGPCVVDWVAGMFMLFRSEAYRRAGGFDERFFLYYEDVDICRRLGVLGYPCAYQPEASVTHDARRASRRNLKLMAIHAASLARYLARRYG
jgi:N-acetylglucosaminyl-diphospho-decaprenol L-rhamnosyltransferase